MHFDALKQRKNSENYKLLEEIRDNTGSGDSDDDATKEPPQQEQEDATNETSEHETGPMHQDADKEDPNDAAQKNNEKAATQDDNQGKKKQGLVGKMMSSMLGGIKNMIGSIVKGFKKFVKFFVVGIALLAGAALMVTGQGIELFRGMRKLFDNLIEMLVPIIDTAMIVFGGLMEMILGVSNALVPAITAIFEQLVPVVQTIMDVLMRVFNILLAALAPVIDVLVNEVLPPVITVFNQLVGFFMKIVEFLAPITLLLGELLGVVAGVLGTFFSYFSDYLSVIESIFSGDMVSARRYAEDMADRLPIMLADIINGIVEFVAGILDYVPGEKAEKGAAYLRSLKVDFGDEAQARIDKRGEADGSTAKRKSKEVDMEQPTPEFKAALEAKVADGSMTETVAGQLLAMKEEQEAAKTASIEPPTGPNQTDMIMDAISDSLANSTADTATMAEKFEVSQAELNAGRGTIVDTSDYVDTIPATPASMVNEGTTQSSEAQKDASGGGTTNTSVSAPVITNTQVANKKSTTTFGMGSSGSSSLGHRHRRVLPGIA